MYLREICGREEGAPPPVDLAAEKRNGDFVRALIGEGAVSAVHDISDGGLLVAVAEMAMASGIGAALVDAERPGARLLVRRGPGALSRHRAGGASRRGHRAHPDGRRAGARGSGPPAATH